jgi:Ca2+-binding RTX toxin-like protein
VFVAKYDVSGDEVWTRQFGTPATDLGQGLAVDTGGAVYVAGYTSGTLPGQTSAGSLDAFVRKYTASGSEAWTRQFGTASTDLGLGVAVDANGAVFVAGSTGGALHGEASYGESDVFVRKYDSQGHVMWTRQFGSADGDGGHGIAADSADGVYVVGNTVGSMTGEVQGGEDMFVAKLANDTPTCNGLDATIVGTDLVVGTPHDDVIVGSPGSDEIRGLAGDDVICGGAGDDTVIGGTGNDVLYGGAGNDLIKGLPGDDVIHGGLGDDRLQGNAGEDVLGGGDGKDKLWGGIEADTLAGQDGNDQLHGGPGADRIDGGPGTDRIWGDAHDDTVSGGANSDYLYGGIGDDVLRGNDGHDRLFGYRGADKLYGGEGRDQLRGQQGDDLVDGGPAHDYCSVETVWVDCETAL